MQQAPTNTYTDRLKYQPYLAIGKNINTRK